MDLVRGSKLLKPSSSISPSLAFSRSVSSASPAVDRVARLASPADKKVSCHPLRVAAVTPRARESISRSSPRNRRNTASHLRWRDIRPPRPKPTPPEAVVCVFIVTLLRITSAYRVSQRTVERTTVFLAVTGGEAMYADMGHFGRFPIRLAWFTIALPCLALNYFGQGALLITDPSTLENPFYELAPAWAHYPLIALATAAAIIASQAIISGTFSLSQQAIQLGFLPRISIRHTASHERGQIYVPLVNWLLGAVTI